MSAYATLRITREKAVSVAIDQIMQACDEDLSKLLDMLLEDRLYKVAIVDSRATETDDDVL